MTRRVASAFVLVGALTGCSAAADGENGKVRRDFERPAAMSEAASSVLEKCTVSTEPDITQATYEDCDLEEFPGVSVRLSVYPSENQASKGAEYYSSNGPAYSEKHWAVATSGDQKHLDLVLSALAGASKG